MGNMVLLLFCFAAGILLRRARRLPENTSAALNAFIINISLPAMALGYINKIEPDPALLYPAAMPWILFLVGAAILWPLCRVMALSRRTTGAVILLGGMANTSFVGIPMIEAFYGAAWMSIGVVADQLGSFIVLAVLGITVARVFADGPRPTASDIVNRIVRFPPFVATVAALLLLPFTYPAWLDTVLMRLADTVAPLALVSVGFQLRLSSVTDHKRPLVLALTYKLLVGPLIILAIYVGVLGAEGQIIQVTVFEAAMAPMISAAIVAMENDLDPPLATLLVALGIPISFVTLPIWYQALLWV